MINRLCQWAETIFKKARTDRHALKLDYITFDLPEILWLALSLACFSSLSFAEGREEEKNKESESHLHYKTITWTNYLHSTSLFATAVVSHQRRQNTGGRAFFFKAAFETFWFLFYKEKHCGPLAKFLTWWEDNFVYLAKWLPKFTQ